MFGAYKMFLSGTVQCSDGTKVSVESFPSGRLTTWCSADKVWTAAYRRNGTGFGDAPSLAVTIDGTEYTAKAVSQSGGGTTGKPHRVTATVDLPGGKRVQLNFCIVRTKWSLVA
jgi:hypothetical protein